MCPVGAISLVDRMPVVNHEVCTHCGACVTVCPTQALESSWLPWKRLVSDALRAVEESDGSPVLVCEAASGDNALPLRRGFCPVPCLERIDEALLLSMVAAGAERIVLVPGDCSTCKIGCNGAVWSLVVDYTRELISSIGGGVEMTIASGACSGNDDAVSIPISRREALAGAGGNAMRAAGEVIEEIIRESRYGEIADALGLFGEDSLLEHASRGQVCAWALGALALSEAGDAQVAIDHLGETQVITRVFGEPLIDLGTCSNCFLCTAYCREHAIEKVKDGAKVKGFRISSHRCNGCGVCVDVCRPGALRINHHVKLADVLCEKPRDILYEERKR